MLEAISKPHFKFGFEGFASLWHPVLKPVVEKAVFKTLVFLLPTQLAFHLWPSWAHIFGIRIDYLSPTFYLTDFLIGLLFLFWFIRRVKISQKVVMWGMAFLLFAVLNIYFSQSLFPAIFRWIKVFECIFLGFYIATKKDFQLKEWLIQPLILSAIVFSSIGIGQVLFQRTLGSIFYYLGERTFSSATPGIALVEIFGRNFLRAYSTFSHPNSFGGYLSVSFLLILGYAKKGKLKYFALLFSLSGIVLSFSLGVCLALILVCLIYYFRKRIQKKGVYIIFGGIIVLSLLLPFASRDFLTKYFSDNQTIMRRLALAEISQEMIFEKPILGVGLNNYILKLSQQNLYPQVSWWLQPVHNIFLLIFSETGLVGLLLFLFLIFKAMEGSLKISLQSRVPLCRINYKLIIPILFILITGLIDHYWITLQQNILLFAMVLGLSLRKWKTN